jgi:hypothetical protein
VPTADKSMASSPVETEIRDLVLSGDGPALQRYLSTPGT